jgi:hypothetical protein
LFTEQPKLREALAFHPEIARDHTDFDLPELVRHFSLELFTIVSFISFLFYLAHGHSTVSWHSWDSSVIDVDYIE